VTRWSVTAFNANTNNWCISVLILISHKMFAPYISGNYTGPEHHPDCFRLRRLMSRTDQTNLPPLRRDGSLQKRGVSATERLKLLPVSFYRRAGGKALGRGVWRPDA
jgi:hypothetical protein